MYSLCSYTLFNVSLLLFNDKIGINTANRIRGTFNLKVAEDVSFHEVTF